MVSTLQTKPGAGDSMNMENKDKIINSIDLLVPGVPQETTKEFSLIIQWKSTTEIKNGKPEMKAICIKANTKIRRYVENPKLECLYCDLDRFEEGQHFDFALYHIGKEDFITDMINKKWKNFRVMIYKKNRSGFLGPINASLIRP